MKMNKLLFLEFHYAIAYGNTKYHSVEMYNHECRHMSNIYIALDDII